jgi:hypothetical protein
MGLLVITVNPRFYSVFTSFFLHCVCSAARGQNYSKAVLLPQGLFHDKYKTAYPCIFSRR